MATYDVAQRSAIVTGAGSGIGRAIAHLLAANGAAVVVSDLDGDAVDTVVQEITEAGGTAIEHVGDVTDPKAAADAVALATVAAPLGIAVNNAGIAGATVPTGEYTVDEWRKVIEINLNGVQYGMREKLPAMVAAGGGSIVNIASMLGSVGFAESSAYVAAKHGVVGLTKVAAPEYAQQGVRVNSVGPGFIRTPLVESALDAEALSLLESKHAMDRLGTSDEVAHLVAFVASDAASFITGSFHLVDGGFTAQ